MTSFHPEKCCHLVGAHAASASFRSIVHSYYLFRLFTFAIVAFLHFYFIYFYFICLFQSFFYICCILLQQREQTELLEARVVELRQQLDSFQQDSSSGISKMQADLVSAVTDRFISRYAHYLLT